jgi:two-component system heavy metal sensor histidine kinase CusS
MDASSYQRFLNLFMLMLLAAGFSSIGILSVTVWWTIKRGANPINELASRIEGISDDDLNIRLNEGSVLRELVPIVQKLNMVLDRLEASFSRERGFTSDAAHELRTPLAGLKSTIEVALARKREGIEYRETLERSLKIVNQLENLVKSLLALSRLESGREKVTGNEIQLKNCILDSWRPYDDEAQDKHLGTSFALGSGRKVFADGHLLSQVLEELFRNAVYYADEGGTISVTLSDKEGETRLQVTNTGSKVGAEEVVRVFDRFWRGGHCRDDTGMRFGLGLPIVKKIAETTGIGLDVQTVMNGEFTVTLIIPETDRS